MKFESQESAILFFGIACYVGGIISWEAFKHLIKSIIKAFTVE